jgi:hypothetical protein
VSIARTTRRIKRRSAAAAVALVLVSFFARGGVGFASTSRVTSVSGAFTIVVPRGFHNDTAAFAGGAIRIELLVAGPTDKGFAVNINVVRERTGTLSLGTVVHGAMIELKRVSRATDFSTVQDLTVGGAPARAFGYHAPLGATRILHYRQAYVIHDGWGYVVTYSALPGAQYKASFSALNEALASWEWR